MSKCVVTGHRVNVLPFFGCLLLLHKTRRYRYRYASLLLAPAAKAFFALRAKKELIMLFWPIFGNFWCPVVTLVTFSSNLSNFERNPQKTKKKKPKNQKISKNLKNLKKD